MTLSDVKEALHCTIAGTTLVTDTLIRSVAAGDLMSDVLVRDDDHLLLVTNLSTDQVARTADIVDAVGIILAGAKKPQEAMITLADELGLPVLVSPLSLFETCAALHELMVRRNR